MTEPTSVAHGSNNGNKISKKKMSVGNSAAAAAAAAGPAARQRGNSSGGGNQQQQQGGQGMLREWNFSAELQHQTAKATLVCLPQWEVTFIDPDDSTGPWLSEVMMKGDHGGLLEGGVLLPPGAKTAAATAALLRGGGGGGDSKQHVSQEQKTTTAEEGTEEGKCDENDKTAKLAAAAASSSSSPPPIIPWFAFYDTVNTNTADTWEEVRKRVDMFYTPLAPRTPLLQYCVRAVRHYMSDPRVVSIDGETNLRELTIGKKMRCSEMWNLGGHPSFHFEVTLADKTQLRSDHIYVIGTVVGNRGYLVQVTCPRKEDLHGFLQNSLLPYLCQTPLTATISTVTSSSTTANRNEEEEEEEDNGNNERVSRRTSGESSSGGGGGGGYQRQRGPSNVSSVGGAGGEFCPLRLGVPEADIKYDDTNDFGTTTTTATYGEKTSSSSSPFQILVEQRAAFGQLVYRDPDAAVQFSIPMHPMKIRPDFSPLQTVGVGSRACLTLEMQVYQRLCEDAVEAEVTGMPKFQAHNVTFFLDAEAVTKMEYPTIMSIEQYASLKLQRLLQTFSDAKVVGTPLVIAVGGRTGRSTTVTFTYDGGAIPVVVKAMQVSTLIGGLGYTVTYFTRIGQGTFDAHLYIYQHILKSIRFLAEKELRGQFTRFKSLAIRLTDQDMGRVYASAPIDDHKQMETHLRSLQASTDGRVDGAMLVQVLTDRASMVAVPTAATSDRQQQQHTTAATTAGDEEGDATQEEGISSSKEKKKRRSKEAANDDNDGSKSSTAAQQQQQYYNTNYRIPFLGIPYLEEEEHDAAAAAASKRNQGGDHNDDEMEDTAEGGTAIHEEEEEEKEEDASEDVATASSSAAAAASPKKKQSSSSPMDAKQPQEEEDTAPPATDEGNLVEEEEEQPFQDLPSASEEAKDGSHNKKKKKTKKNRDEMQEYDGDSSATSSDDDEWDQMMTEEEKKEKQLQVDELLIAAKTEDDIYFGPSVRDVYLHCCDMQQAKPNSYLLAKLPENPRFTSSIEELDLSGNYLGHNGFIAVLHLWEHLPRLQTVFLNDMSLDNTDVNNLVASLLENNRATIVPASSETQQQQQQQDEETGVSSSSSSPSKKKKKMNTSVNQHHHQLRSIHLRNNSRITLPSSRPLTKLIREMKSLQHIALSGTRLGNEVIGKLEALALTNRPKK